MLGLIFIVGFIVANVAAIALHGALTTEGGFAVWVRS